jgi:hypothetical protein
MTKGPTGKFFKKLANTIAMKHKKCFRYGAIQIIRDTLGGRGGVQKCHMTTFMGNFKSKR